MDAIAGGDIAVGELEAVVVVVVVVVVLVWKDADFLIVAEVAEAVGEVEEVEDIIVLEEEEEVFAMRLEEF